MSDQPTTPSPANPPPPVTTILPPFRVAALDQSTLLTVVALRCAPACRVTTLSPERVIVKYDPARTYLALTPAQWQTLHAFGPGHTVPEVLFRLISDRQCIPLREFYELVIKAFHLGILQADGQSPPPDNPPSDWRWRLPGGLMRGLALAAIVGALVAFVLRPLQLPQNVLHLLAGWLLACGATSAGYWLGACVVRRANAEVYAVRLNWKTLAPHFAADLDDAIMGGLQTSIDASLARLAPMFAAAGLAAFLAPGVVLPLYCGLLLLLCPFWWTAGLTLAFALYGTPQLDAIRHFRFEPNRVLWYALRTRLKHANLRFLGVHALYALVWLGLVLLSGVLQLRANAADLWEAYLAAGGLHFTALALLALLGLMVVGTLGTFGWIGYRLARDWWQEKQPHRPRPQPASATPEAIAALLEQSLLFRALPADDRTAIAAAVRVEAYPPQAMILREGEPGDLLYLVFSGQVEVLRDLASGRPEPVAVLAAGEVFGEIALLHSGRRTRSVRALGNCVLLSLSRDAFQRLVLSRLSRDQVEDTIQKVAFLHRIPLAGNWSSHAMTAFARRAVFQVFSEGDYIIRENEDNQFFYLLYEGELVVRRQRKDLALLHAGEFFGEISLLQNSVAKATIVARTPARCLIMNKRDFLQYLAKDFLIGLQFEAISSQRLGEPIFPLKGKSFDVLRG